MQPKTGALRKSNLELSTSIPEKENAIFAYWTHLPPPLVTTRLAVSHVNTFIRHKSFDQNAERTVDVFLDSFLA